MVQVVYLDIFYERPFLAVTVQEMQTLAVVWKYIETFTVHLDHHLVGTVIEVFLLDVVHVGIKGSLV